MSDDLNTFIRKTDAMIDEVIEHQELVGRLYFRRIAAHLIRWTPGPNLQWPETTEYIAKGQLRGGWSHAAAPIGAATVWDDGPRDEDGSATLFKIEADLARGRLPAEAYIVNNVAYGFIIEKGLGRHTTARPGPFGEDGRHWVANTPLHAELFLRDAVAEAGTP